MMLSSLVQRPPTLISGVFSHAIRCRCGASGCHRRRCPTAPISCVWASARRGTGRGHEHRIADGLHAGVRVARLAALPADASAITTRPPPVAVLGLGGVGRLLWPGPMRRGLCVPLGAVPPVGLTSLRSCSGRTAESTWRLNEARACVAADRRAATSTHAAPRASRLSGAPSLAGNAS